ncbi:MAG: hypothetical protein ACK58T_12955 [Phycisphaerae bacterium]
MPYYGLLREIRDRQGNTARIEYATVLEWPNGGGPPVQSTTQKGAVSRVQLFAAADPNTPVWTLVYTYRLVPRANSAAATPFAGLGSPPQPPSLENPPPTPEGDYRDNGAGWPGAHWHDMTPQAKVAWSDPVLECVYVFDGNVETRGITLMRSPAESLWPKGSPSA